MNVGSQKEGVRPDMFEEMVGLAGFEPTNLCSIPQNQEIGNNVLILSE